MAPSRSNCIKDSVKVKEMTKIVSSKSPGKQRKKNHSAPVHANKNRLKCRLDEFLQEQYGLRSLVVKTGDLAKIMRGQFRDTEGKVVRVDYKDVRVFLDSATVTKADGKEVNIPIHPSNIKLVKLEMNDERKQLIESKVMKVAESEE
ncbi:MAG: 50S ribosomal protein L24 [Candidatus Thorarchaeota archaeon]|nr:MAG: 50S ribosomal protein L24 [Candidatus Thorarchaeota archaeon]